MRSPLTTRQPVSEAAARSTLSMPTPARPTTFRRPLEASNTSRVICGAVQAVAERALAAGRKVRVALGSLAASGGGHPSRPKQLARRAVPRFQVPLRLPCQQCLLPSARLRPAALCRTLGDIRFRVGWGKLGFRAEQTTARSACLGGGADDDGIHQADLGQQLVLGHLVAAGRRQAKQTEQGRVDEKQAGTCRQGWAAARPCSSR